MSDTQDAREGDNRRDSTEEREPSYLREAMRLAFPSDLPEPCRFTMCFTAYFDETGTDDRSPIVGIAGYLSLPSMWESFETQWNTALTDFGIKATRWPYWRQSSFAHSTRQFTGWSDDEVLRRERFARALDIVNGHVVYSCGVFMRKGDYYAHVSPEANAWVGGPYGLAASALMIYAADALDLLGVVGKIAYVFEAGAEGAGEVAKVFNDNLRSPGNRDRHRLLSIRFEDKRRYVPLQAADIVAHEVGKQGVNQLRGSLNRPRFPLYTLNAIPHNWGYMGVDQLKMWSRIISARTRLRRDELECLPAEPERLGVKWITLQELRERSEWMRFFMKEEDQQTVTIR